MYMIFHHLHGIDLHIVGFRNLVQELLHGLGHRTDQDGLVDADCLGPRALLAGHARFGQNTMLGSITVLLALLGNMPREV
jgi:hypothetical protein